MRILYVGDLWEGGTALHRAKALADLGHQVVHVDSTQPWKGPVGLTNRAVRKWGRAWDFRRVNQELQRKCVQHPFQVVWVDKGLTIQRETLRCVRNATSQVRLVSYHPDDIANLANCSRRYLTSVPLYDLHVTHRVQNLRDLRTLGARDVLRIHFSYAPTVHRPLVLSELDRRQYGADIGFVGTYEPDRAAQLFQLARRGLTVMVWGPGWRRCRYSHPKLQLRFRPLWGEDYVKAVNATRVNLCFLRKANRDQHTTRTFEIPACGGFMLAERTAEHLRLFRETEEAEYFGSIEELERKCRYYLAHEEQRQDVARRARKRCVEDTYSNQHRVAEILAHLD